MGIFDIEENIKKDPTVGDFYNITISNLGMTGSLEENAEKVFKGFTLDEVREGIKNAPIKEFDKLFIYPTGKWINLPNGDGFHIVWIGGWRLRRFLKKWVKKQYITDVDDLHWDIRPNGNRFIQIYNGEVIEMATGAGFGFWFEKK